MQSSTNISFYIDYHKNDKDWAAWVTWQIEEQEGFRVFFEEWDLLAGQNHEQTRDELLKTVDFIVVVLSPDYDMSDKNSILSFALSRDRQKKQNTIIPVLVRECQLQGLLSPLVPINLVGLDHEEDVRKQLINWISRRRRKPNEEPMLSFLKRDGRVEVEQTLSSISLLPIWHIPYPIRSYFVKRDAIFKAIEDSLNAGKVVAIVRPKMMNSSGGIGKTQIAIEYANHHHPQKYKFVFWAKADSYDTFTWELLKIASQLKLPEKNALDHSLVARAVERWLKDHSEWLLILDNVEEPEVVKDFIALSNSGHILLTTRTQALRNIAEIQCIELQKLEPEEGALLLLRRAGRIAPNASLDNVPETDHVTAQEISEAMLGHPLALEHAGAYIARTTIDDLSIYLNHYQTRQTELSLQKSVSDVLLLEPALTTWLLSFRLISPIAQNLLYLCAFLCPDAVPQETLVNSIQKIDLNLLNTEVDQFQLRAAFTELVEYSLLFRESENRTLFTMPSLLQTIIRGEMDKNTQHAWAERAVRVVSYAFPLPEFSTCWQCRLYIPQARACIELIEQWHLQTSEAAQLLDRAGYYLGYYVQDPLHFARAKSLCKLALDIRMTLFDLYHSDVATSHNHLALLYRIQGNSELAGQHYQQAQQIWQHLLKADGLNPSLDHLDDLAEFYFMHREYDQAEPFYIQALQIRKQIFGAENPEVVSSLHKLAELYFIQGKYAQAEPLYQQVLTIREMAVPLDLHNTVQVIQSLNTLASLCETQGNYMQAESLYHRALVLSKQTLNSTYVVQSLNNLALFYRNQGKYAQAEILFKQALDNQEQIEESDSLYIAQCLNNLASLYRIQGKYDQATALYGKALHIHEQTLGPNHLSVAYDLNNLAALYSFQCQYDQAKSLYERARDVLVQVLGPDCSEVACGWTNLALLYRVQGDYDHALSNYQQAVDIQKQVFGKNHYEVANGLNDMAEVYYAQGKYDQAELQCKAALEIQEQTLGRDHLDVARTLKNLARLYYIQNDYTEAESLYKRVQEIYEHILGSEHLDVASALSNLAVLYRSQGDHLQVDPLYKRILAIRERSLGSEHLDVANILDNLAMLSRSRAEYRQAEWLYRRVLAIHEQTLGPEHLHMAVDLENYSYLLQKLERKAEAASMEARAREIRIKHANE
jgi:tetratricopeptide (TPR) repeat protein